MILQALIKLGVFFIFSIMKTFIRKNPKHNELVDVRLVIVRDEHYSKVFEFTYPKCFIEEENEDGLAYLKIPINKLFNKTLLK